MVNCAVYNCNSNNKKQKSGGDGNQSSEVEPVKFFRFPQNADLSKIWEQKCGRKDKFILKNNRICSKHFLPEHYTQSLRHRLLNYSPSNSKKLNIDAIPTENLPNRRIGKNNEYTSVLQRRERKEKRDLKDVVQRARALKEIKKREALELLFQQRPYIATVELIATPFMPSSTTPEDIKQNGITIKTEPGVSVEPCDTNYEIDIEYNNITVKVEPESTVEHEEVPIVTDSNMRSRQIDTFLEFVASRLSEIGDDHSLQTAMYNISEVLDNARRGEYICK